MNSATWTDAQALAYIASYADLRRVLGADPEAGRRHYADAGGAENRNITFDSLTYIASYTDLVSAFGVNAAAGARHFIVNGAKEGRSASFDALRYIASYGDLIAAFGTNTDAATRHYISAGASEGRNASFDALRYTASYRDLIAAFGTNTDAATRHYISTGVSEGRSASFDALRYIASYSDLIATFGTNTDAATRHYISAGASEGRNASFDALRYIASYRDLIAAFGTNTDAATRHYIAAGVSEGRSASFDALRYIASYGDLITAFGTDMAAATRHYVTAGVGEGRRATFDGFSYIASYADLTAAFGANEMAGIRHYIVDGRKEGRAITFDALRYIASYGDLINAFGADAQAGARHYLQAGRSEGRSASFDSVAYLLSNTDLSAAGLDADGALRHWVAAGYKEGRSASGAFGSDQGGHALSLGATTTGAIERTGDRDWFGITLEAGKKINFNLGFAAGKSGMLTVYDEFGRVVQTGTGPNGINLTAEKAGLYYVVVSGDLGASYTIAPGNFFETITGTSGSDTLTGTDGADTIRGLGGSDTLLGRGGNDILEGGEGYDQLNGGLGDDVLYGNNATNSGSDYSYDSLTDDQGGNDKLYGQDGDDTLYISRSGTMAASTVTLDGGNGDDYIRFWSTRFLDTVTISGGEGKDDISTGSVLKSVIDAGAGNDKVNITMLGGDQTITLGTGADVLTLEGNSYSFASGNPTTVTDFQTGTDTINIDKYLADTLIGWDKVANPFATGHLKLVQSGSDTLLQLDRDGSSGSSYSLATLLTLSNTTASAFTAKDLGFAPDGSAPVGQTITGTSGSDTLTGTDGADTIRGLGGSDTLLGRGGNDILEGGEGYDQLNGGLGDDVLYGNNATNSGSDYSYDSLTDDQGGNDKLYGQDGDDTLYISRSGTMAASTVTLDGGNGDDYIRFWSTRFLDTVTISGGEGKDDISTGSVLKSVIDAGAGNDKVNITMLGGDQTITLGTGADVLTLEGNSYSFASGNPTTVTDFQTGTDTINIDKYLADTLIGWDKVANPFATGHLKLVQSGSDTLLQLDRDGSSGSSYSLATLLTLSNTTASAFTAKDLGFAPDGSAPVGQTITGTSGSDTLTGTDGADTIRGLGGSDTLLGRGGNDILEGGEGYDQLNGGLGDDVLYGNNATNSGSDYSYDSLTDDQGGNDKLYGQDGDDTLYISRSGTMAASTVTLDGGNGDDYIRFWSTRFLDTVTISGGEGKDDISTGSVLKSVIDAGAGNDKVNITMLGGDQTITLGTGADVLTLEGNSYSFASGNPTTVTDFQIGTDTINIDKYLADTLIGWDKVANPFATGHLKLVQSGSDTLLQLDRDGSTGSSYSLATLLTLSNTTASAFTAKDLGFAPNATRAAFEDDGGADMGLSDSSAATYTDMPILMMADMGFIHA